MSHALIQVFLLETGNQISFLSFLDDKFCLFYFFPAQHTASENARQLHARFIPAGEDGGAASLQRQEQRARLSALIF